MPGQSGPGASQKGRWLMTRTLLFAGRDRSQHRPSGIGKWTDQVLGPAYHNYRPDQAWSPAVNVYEDATSYCVVVDLAGVHRNEIDLLVKDGMMTISGRRSMPGPVDLVGKAKVHLMEVEYGQFFRSIELPDEVDVEAIGDAKYRGGFLWIRLPKKV